MQSLDGAIASAQKDTQKPNRYFTCCYASCVAFDCSLKYTLNKYFIVISFFNHTSLMCGLNSPTNIAIGIKYCLGSDGRYLLSYSRGELWISTRPESADKRASVTIRHKKSLGCVCGSYYLKKFRFFERKYHIMQCVRRQPVRTKSQESVYRAQMKTVARSNLKLIGRRMNRL